MKVVITGPTGAIGMALIQKCIERDIPVLAICHRESTRIRQLPKHPLVTVMQIDLSEYEAYAQMCEADATKDEKDKNGKLLRAWSSQNGRIEPENPTQKENTIFIHLAWNGTTGAARNDTALQLKNIQHTLDAVRLAKALSCDTFIGAGSQAEYGKVEGNITPQTPTFPQMGYGIAKLCAGQMSRLLCSQLGIRHIWMRILSVYGPYDGQQAMLPSLIRKLAKGEKMPLTKGEQIWDYLYSVDAADAILALAKNGKDGRVYCLGSGVGKPLRSYIEECAKAVWEYRTKNDRDQREREASESFEEFVQSYIGFGEIAYHPQQTMHLCADITALREDTGYVPDTEFTKGIRKTVAVNLQKKE